MIAMSEFWSNPKGIKTTGKSPTKAQQKRWTNIRLLGCIICGGVVEIHHCGTGAGGRKDHSKTIGLCFHHHSGLWFGIHSVGREKWQLMFGTENELLAKTNIILGLL